VVYDVWTMRRTNIYLDEEQLRALKALGETRGEPVSGLVREALDDYLRAHGVRVIADDEWERRFDALFNRRDRVAKERAYKDDEIERDVSDAVREVRKARAARRR
jgi:predicted transcriptional regulator